MARLILSIDQGTTSSRAMLFDEQGEACFTAQREFTQHFPADGWVEHDAEEIWTTTLTVTREALASAASSGDTVAAIGITNQRETTVAWDRDTGKPVHRAIVWQDRRTAERCAALRDAGHEPAVSAKTGLLLDPYFSATKLSWILQNVEEAAKLAERDALAFGTIDSFLIWRLTGGSEHVTDATNASRTMLFNIHEQSWDDELLELFGIPRSCLPDVKDSAADFGMTDTQVVGGAIPIAGVAGDQQAALVGQACLRPGMIKSTYGTGCFVVLNTGTKPVVSRNKLLTTVAYRLQGQPSYAIEGSIFVAGAGVQWLRDKLGFIESAEQSEALASGLGSNAGVYMIPAFTGLGAPYWDPHARGAIFGLTRDTGIAEIVRATLESVAYQTSDLLTAMQNDGAQLTGLRVDGGMTRNDWLCQFLANVLDVSVERPAQTETTALGAAYLAGLHCGMFDSVEALEAKWRCENAFQPAMESNLRDQLLRGWSQAVTRVTDG
ncbi:MAG: glycerol kinase GlpK [Gammaproteobacteria bacterium]|nr:glycerol kinase GlpK [Gammaproteobacteria bacterium]